MFLEGVNIDFYRARKPPSPSPSPSPPPSKPKPKPTSIAVFGFVVSHEVSRIHQLRPHKRFLESCEPRRAYYEGMLGGIFISSDTDSPALAEHLCSRSSRKTLIYLILTLYQMYPDYDFSAVNAHQFFISETRDSFEQIFDSYMSEASKLWVESYGGGSLLEDLYKALDEVVKLSECEIYSYNPDCDADPFLQRGAIWSFNFFFYNRKLKRVVSLCFSCIRVGWGWGGGGVGTRRTRSSRKVEELLVSVKRAKRAKNVDEAVLRKVIEENVVGVGDYREVDNVGVVEGKKSKGGRVGRKKVAVKYEFRGNLANNVDEAVLRKVMGENVAGIGDYGEVDIVGVVEDRRESDLVLEDQVMRACELDTSYDGRVTGQESVQVPNLEKMTVGEWLDYLDVYLPKQIYTVTDEIIDDMRKRAKQFAVFMLQQQKEKGMLSYVLVAVFHTFGAH
ncbi:hypothetical protein KSS87_006493 [Heliosperma pusillum]|nr:hypothetical protein KSS87_006493 [Heliosperma pusillum]